MRMVDPGAPAKHYPIICFFLIAFFPIVVAQTIDYLVPVFHSCSNSSTALSSIFTQDLNVSLTNLTRLSALSLFNTTSSGTGINEAYSMFQCRGDVSLPSCSRCVSNATATLKSSCPDSIGALIQLDGCYLRYDNNNFLTPNYTFVQGGCSSQTNNATTFLQTVGSLLQNVTTLAAQHDGFATMDAEGAVFALAQCLGYLSATECSLCLSQNLDVWRQCDSVGAQIHSVSCYYRYEVYPFYTTATPSPTPPPETTNSPAPALTSSPSPASPRPVSTAHRKGGSKIPIIIGSVVGGLCAIVIVCTFMRLKKVKKRQDAQPDGESESVFQPMAAIFSLDELKVATQNFHPHNKLGEGGFGPVYKGTLSDGVDVAVKQLSSRSHQGKREFMNEVNIITNVQHRNLIKLLGCCVEGSERILVYEYLPNKSLDQLLFDNSEDNRTLDWPTRHGIVMGVARGLSYLHEDSQVRIIHRDIKPSNILLDADLNPKIADFGLARLISDDKSHVSTRVAGTLGYLAPEYAMHGHLTEKADVFSFGLVTLEVVTGRRHTDIQLPSEKQRLLEWTWRLYQEQRQLELVDPKLNNNFNHEQVIRIVHVALLCTQASSGLRPTMSKVTMMLSGWSEILEIPTKPAFIEISDGIGGSPEPVNPTRYMPQIWRSSSSSSPPSSASSSNPLSHMSQNSVSISEIEPR